MRRGEEGMGSSPDKKKNLLTNTLQISFPFIPPTLSSPPPPSLCLSPCCLFSPSGPPPFFSLPPSRLPLFHSSAFLRTESSPRILQSSLSRCCISGMPASWASSRCFSSVRVRRVAVSSCSKRQPPSPSNCSRWVWYFLDVTRAGKYDFF